MAQSRSLARAQRVAMAVITGQWHPSHSLQLAELSLQPLDTRRTRLCRRFAKQTATRSQHMVLPGVDGRDRVNKEGGEGALQGAYLQVGRALSQQGPKF